MSDDDFDWELAHIVASLEPVRGLDFSDLNDWLVAHTDELMGGVVLDEPDDRGLCHALLFGLAVLRQPPKPAHAGCEEVVAL